MNTNDRIDAQIVIGRELENGLLETWNSAELAGDVITALELAGWEIRRLPTDHMARLYDFIAEDAKP